jgi:hypothetical protein
MRGSESAPRSELVAERAGINLYSEHSLHSQLKEWLSEPGDRSEVLVDGRVVDLLKADGELVEVQTGSLGKIVPKALVLAASGRRVRVVYPVAAETSIRRLDPKTGELLSVRKSPKRGDVWSLFDELVKAHGLIAAPLIEVEVLLVKAVDIKVRDGSGSWRSRGDRRADRILEEVISSRRLGSRSQWLALIPGSLPPPWSSASLGEALGIRPDRARKVLYCLARAGLLAETGKEGRRKLYELPAREPAKKAGKSRRSASHPVGGEGQEAGAATGDLPGVVAPGALEG